MVRGYCEAQIICVLIVHGVLDVLVLTQKPVVRWTIIFFNSKSTFKFVTPTFLLLSNNKVRDFETTNYSRHGTF